jgi:hypothetical protein
VRGGPVGTFSGVIARTSRPLVLAALLGVVVLGLLVAFSVSLPSSSDEPATDRASADTGNHDPITLPESLPGQWTAVDVADPANHDAAAAAEFAKQQKETVAYVNDTLGKVYPDYPTAFRAYANDDLTSFVTLTVFGAPGGAFSPNGFASAERLKLARATVELVRAGDAVCQVNWQSVPAGQEFPADAVPLATTCQLSRDGRTYQLATQGMAVDGTAGLLVKAADEVVAADAQDQ